MSQELTDARAISSRIKGGAFPKAPKTKAPKEKEIPMGEVVTDVVPPMQTRTGIENIVDAEIVEPKKAIGTGQKAIGTGQKQITTGQRMLPGRQFADIPITEREATATRTPGTILQGKKIKSNAVDIDEDSPTYGQVKDYEYYQITEVPENKKKSKKKKK